MNCPFCGIGFKPANSDFRPFCSESCKLAYEDEIEEELESLRDRVRRLEELLEPFAVTTDVWCVSCDPDMHAESVALFTDEQRARQFCRAMHGESGRVEKRVITGGFGK